MGFHCICFSCSHALCFSPLTPSDSRLESPVCREEYSAGEAVRKPPCLHYFHNKCVVVELVRARGGCGRDVRACGICHDLSRVLNWGLWQQHRRVFCFNAPESFGWRPSGQCLWMQHLKKSQHECPPGLESWMIQFWWSKVIVSSYCIPILAYNVPLQLVYAVVTLMFCLRMNTFFYLPQHDTCPMCRKSLYNADMSLSLTSEDRSTRTEQQGRQATRETSRSPDTPFPLTPFK